LPAITEDESDEQRKITTHWLAVLKEKLQPILTEYFDANICCNIGQIIDEYLVIPIVNTQHHHFISSSSNSSSRKNTKNHLES
jgi:hypothetical protein